MCRTACSTIDTLCFMSDPAVYFNGSFVQSSAASLSIFDAGVVHGATLTDRVRTYGGSPFAMQQHIGRFESGLETLGIDLPEAGRLADIVHDVLTRNGAGADRDLAAVLVATPGPPAQRPTLWVHTIVQPRAEWAAGYRNGWQIQTSSIAALPSTTLPRAMKHRSRLHWYLASAAADSDAALSGAAISEVLLLDDDGMVTETAYGNILCVDGGRLIAVTRGRALPGVTEAAVLELARKLGVEVEFSDFPTAKIADADEVLLTSTGYTIAPVTRIDHTVIGSGSPGPMWSRLATEFSRSVSFDFVAQALRFSADG